METDPPSILDLADIECQATDASSEDRDAHAARTILTAIQIGNYPAARHAWQRTEGATDSHAAAAWAAAESASKGDVPACASSLGAHGWPTDDLLEAARTAMQALRTRELSLIGAHYSAGLPGRCGTISYASITRI